MAHHGYMSIIGKKQGLISSGCSSQDSIGNKCQVGHFDRNIADDYERAYKQTGKLSLALEALVDSITIQSLYTAMKPDDAAEK